LQWDFLGASENGVHRLYLDAADASSINDSDIDVALLAPGTAPLVANNVEWLARRICTISNSGDTVIEFDSTRLGVEYTARIVDEDTRVSINSHRDRAISNCCLECLRIFIGNRFIISRCSDNLARAILAFLSESNVGVSRFFHHSEIFSILETKA